MPPPFVQYRVSLQAMLSIRDKIKFHICRWKLNVITCLGCGNHFIVKMGKSLRRRTTLHTEHIRYPKYRQVQVIEHKERYARNLILNFLNFAFSMFAERICAVSCNKINISHISKWTDELIMNTINLTHTNTNIPTNLHTSHTPFIFKHLYLL